MQNNDQPSNRLDSYISLLRQKIEKRAISFDSDTKLFVLENATFLILLRIFDETLKHRRGSASLSKTVKKSNIGYAEIGGCSANLKFEWNSPNRLERLWSGTRYPYRSTRGEDRIERRIVSSNERNHRSLIARLLKYYLIPARSEHLAIVQRNLHRLLLLSFSFPLPLSLSSIETRSSISPFPS